MALLVSTTKIDRCEVLCTSHLIQQVLVLWQWVQIFYHELKCMIVHAKL